MMDITVHSHVGGISDETAVSTVSLRLHRLFSALNQVSDGRQSRNRLDPTKNSSFSKLRISQNIRKSWLCACVSSSQLSETDKLLSEVLARNTTSALSTG